MSRIRAIIAALAAFFFQTSEKSVSRMTVSLEVRDDKGRLVSSGPVGEFDAPPATSLFPRSLRLAGWLLLLALTGLAIYQSPAIGWAVPLFGRVATAGLNQLLTATLLSPATWYVGLMGAAASDGVSTATSTTFTSASGSFAAGDVGRNILVMGAGVGGLDLLTTIAAVGGATSITLGAAASTTLSGARYALECRAADTMGSHASFVSDTNWSQGTRPAWTPGAVSAGSVDNSASPAVFTMTGATYIFGAFLANDSTKTGTIGILYGAGVNSTALVARVQNNFTINATITPSITAA